MQSADLPHPSTFRPLFHTPPRAKKLSVNVSFFEIYGGKVFDLLNKQKRLRVLEDGNAKVQVVGLIEKVCRGRCAPWWPLSMASEILPSFFFFYFPNQYRERDTDCHLMPSFQGVNSIQEVKNMLVAGSRCRATGTTSANEASSRSHAVFQVRVAVLRFLATAVDYHPLTPAFCRSFTPGRSFCAIRQAHRTSMVNSL